MSRVIWKPWGYEEIIFEQGDTRIKKLFVKAGHRTSLQYHDRKEEMISLLMGDGHIEDNGGYHSSLRVKHIVKASVHRLWAKETDAEFLEMSVGSDDDIVRLEDDYGRKGK